MALMQLVAYNIQNESMSGKDLYVLNLNEIPMNKIKIKNNLFFSIDIERNCDEFNILGLIFELDNYGLDNYGSNNYPATKQILKSELKIYSYKCNIDNTPDKNEFFLVGTMPLYLSNISYTKSKIILKFPSNFFSQYSYFCNFCFFKYEIEIDYPFKSILIQKMLKYLDSGERILLCKYYDFYSDNPIQYTANIKLCISSGTEQFDQELILQINQIEKIRGFFFYIPDELFDLIEQIDLNLKNYLGPNNCPTKISFYPNLDNTDKNIIKETDLGKIIWIGINPLDSNPFDHNLSNNTYFNSCLEDTIQIKFKDLSNDEKQIMSEYKRDISIDMMVQNILIGTKFNSKLKYSDGKLNSKLETKELELIDKYSNLSEEIRIDNTITYSVEEYAINLNKAHEKTQLLSTDIYSISKIKKFINRY